MKLLKIMVIHIALLVLAQAQPANNEQILANSGGDAVAMDKEWAVVGDVTNNKAHIFKLDYANFQWVEQNGPTAPQQNLDFGKDVTLSGDYMLIGAPAQGQPSTVDRKAYLYHYNGTDWALEQNITAPDNNDTYFGTAVALQSDGSNVKIAIGAPNKLDNNNIAVGAVYTYSYDGTTLTGPKELKGNTFHTRKFGESLDMKGGYLIVGAPEEESTAGNDSVGAAYIHNYNGTDWVYKKRIKENVANKKLGTYVSIGSDGNVIVSEVSGGSNSAYMYERTGASWSNTYDKLYYTGAVDIDDGTYLMTRPNDRLSYYDSIKGTDSNRVLLLKPTLANPAVSSVSLYKEQTIVNEAGATQARAYDAPCGIKPGKLTAYEWAMVSVPCGDGSATVNDVFGDDGLGTYGTNWVMYKQSDTAVPSSGGSTPKVQMALTDTMQLGESYWIIADKNASWKADDTVITIRTQLDFNRTTDTIAGTYLYPLPDTGTGVERKIMVGNTFSRKFKWSDLRYKTANGSYYSLGALKIYKSTGYVYDSSSTSGQPYRAITSNGTPGFSDEIKPYQGFWILQNSMTQNISGNQLSVPFEK